MEDGECRSRLEALFTEHAGAVRAYARRRVGAEAADDAVSEVFVVAWRRLEEVPSDALPWLLGCARRVLANQRRAARRGVALVERLSVSGAPVGGGGIELADGALARALGALSHGDREILLLLAWEGLEPADVARSLGCSRPTLAVRVHRARKRLAAALLMAESERSEPAPTMEAIR